LKRNDLFDKWNFCFEINIINNGGRKLAIGNQHNGSEERLMILIKVKFSIVSFSIGKTGSSTIGFSKQFFCRNNRVNNFSETSRLEAKVFKV
jgi:hypothetical protein